MPGENSKTGRKDAPEENWQDALEDVDDVKQHPNSNPNHSASVLKEKIMSNNQLQILQQDQTEIQKKIKLCEAMRNEFLKLHRSVERSSLP